MQVKFASPMCFTILPPYIEPAEVVPGTRAFLVFSIDGALDREEVVSPEGISPADKI